MTLPPGARMDFMTGMIPYHHQTVSSIGDYPGVTGSYQRQSPVNPAFTHSCILELRKEKSRDAARSRRGKENYEFYELAKMLPLPPAITSQLDKASIIRLTISYLRLRDFSSHGDPPWARDGQSRGRSMHGMAIDLFEAHQGTHILQSLDGFAFALATDGRFLYVSETVSIYLGLSQVEMTGSTVFEYIHQQDHAEVAEHLGLTPTQTQSMPSPASIVSEDGSSRSTTPTPNTEGKGKLDYSGGMSMMVGPTTTYKGLDRAFCVRMKSTLTKRGCHFKSSGYRVVLLLCHMRPQFVFSHTRKSPSALLGMVGLAIALPPPSVHEVRLESDMFVTRLTFDFKIAHCESKVSDLLEYTAEEMAGRSLYLLCHGADINKLRKCHVDLINKGQVMSQYYRVMNKTGGYVWMQTCATVVCSSKNAEEQSIICVNYVLSRAEYDHVVFDSFQLDTLNPVLKSEASGGAYPENKSPEKEFKSETPIPRPPSSQSKSPGSLSPKSGGGGDHADHLPHLSNDSQSSGAVLSLHGKDPYDDSRIKGDYESTSRNQKRKFAGDDLVNEGSDVTSGKVKTLAGDSMSGQKKCMLSIDSNIGMTNPPPSVGTPVSVGTPGSVGTPKALGDNDLSPHGLDNSANSDTIRWKKMCNGVADSEVRLREGTKGTKDPSEPTDFSTDALLNKQRPTIQWIGTHQPTSTLPASTLLRQLYVNRESVIRSNVHVSRASPYYPEIHSTLPTPPSTDNFSEQFLLGKTGEPFVGLPGYNSSPSVSVVSYPDCHSAVTPPSSVSPREKTLTDSAGYEPNLRHQYNAELSSLKPLVYPVHHSSSPLPHLDTSQYPVSSLGGDQPQFYGHSSPPFHLYHPVVNKMSPSMNYSDNLKNGTSWYPSSS